jgi:hypothetical protein
MNKKYVQPILYTRCMDKAALRSQEEFFKADR